MTFDDIWKVAPLVKLIVQRAEKVKWRHSMIFRDISWHLMIFGLKIMSFIMICHDISWHVMIWPLLIQRGCLKWKSAPPRPSKIIPQWILTDLRDKIRSLRGWNQPMGWKIGTLNRDMHVWRHTEWQYGKCHLQISLLQKALHSKFWGEKHCSTESWPLHAWRTKAKVTHRWAIAVVN